MAQAWFLCARGCNACVQRLLQVRAAIGARTHVMCGTVRAELRQTEKKNACLFCQAFILH